MPQIKNIMFDLKLLGMLHCLEGTLKDATEESWGPTEVLDVLLQAENDFREDKRSERLLKNSKLKIKPALEDFDFTAKRTITRKEIKELYSLEWIKMGRPILIIGPTGVGKTFIAQALGHHACRHKQPVLFMSISDLLEHQMLARTTKTYLKFKAKLTKPSILILDDFGLKKFNSGEAHDFCEILEERMGDKSTIITTQLPLDHWSEVIEDPVIADAIIDRLIHSSIKLTVKGESYRKVKAKKLDQMKGKQ
ncbi:IS21-like element helper ATPase IstB [bacterium]|nr:IS21-like element helper ATPase IstB [bacterium]MBU1916780.1 IS21-like element helper ATPase IstB [bacterium]